MKRWKDLTDEEKTPEAGIREAELRIAEWDNDGILDLSYLQLARIPETIKRLSNLDGLFLDNNQIVELGPLKDLKEIEWLHINSNQVRDLAPLEDLSELKTLLLDYNRITDLTPLRKLKKIKKLDIGNNRISDLSPLQGMNDLIILDLEETLVRSIKPLRFFLERDIRIVFENIYSGDGQYLNLFNCPLESPPLEIAKQGSMAVLKYWDEQDRLGTTYQNEGRLMILGKGKVGKTSLLKKLQDPDCELDPDEDQTHGINIWRDWEFPVLKKKDQTFIASVWDFGGQDVQHLTHQYFLTPGTVYIVMLNKRNTNTSDEYVDLDYWFRIITALGRYPGQQARVLVVHNRFSSDGTAAGIDLAELQERYKDSLQLSLHTVNIKDEVEEMALLRGKIETALLGLPNVGKAIIKGWPVVRTALSQKRATHKRISYDDFTDLCEAEGIKSDGGQRLLLSYLVRLGEVIHYAGTGMLANYVLLDIEWITKTVYGITQNQRFIDREGRFERSEIIDIWEKQGVGRATDHNLMLELLQVNAFELCWKADKTRFLTPTLFSPQVPKDVTPVRADLGLRYSAKYLPDGLMGQLIVRLHGLAENEAWWRKGIYLYDPETKCRALVRQPIAKNHLSITVEGLSPQNYALLRLVKRELDTVIERSFSRIEFTQSIPCPCETCKRGDREQHYFSVRKLHQNRSDGKIKVHCSHENPTPIDVLIDGLKKTLGLHTDNFNQELRELIGGGELKEAVELIEHQYPGEKASLIKLAYTDLLRNQIVGTLSADERSRFRQQLAERLLSFSELLETSGGRGITSTTIEQGVSEIKAQLTSIKSTSEDTNTRLKNLQTSLNQVKQDLDQQTDALFTDRKEQRAFMNRLEEFVEALPKDKQPAPDWYDADQKKKIKVGIDLIKLLNKATGIELEGMNLKWEQELDVSGAKLPESWAAFKQWFMK